MPWFNIPRTKAGKRSASFRMEPGKLVGLKRAFMKKGESFSNFTAGGGGWGHPYERDIEKILEDLKNEYISKGSARDDYGVIIADDGSWSETAERLSHHARN